MKYSILAPPPEPHPGAPPPHSVLQHTTKRLIATHLGECWSPFQIAHSPSLIIYSCQPVNNKNKNNTQDLEKKKFIRVTFTSRSPLFLGFLSHPFLVLPQFLLLSLTSMRLIKIITAVIAVRGLNRMFSIVRLICFSGPLPQERLTPGAEAVCFRKIRLRTCLRLNSMLCYYHCMFIENAPL